MNRFRKLPLIFLLSVSLFTIQMSTSAQNADACPAIVQSALDATDANCNATGRNQACYGFETVEAVPHSETETLAFDVPGDIEETAAIRALHLSGMDVDENIWGMSVLRVQANLLYSSVEQNATYLLFGDVDVTAATPLRDFDATIMAAGSVNARNSPSTDGAVVSTLASGTALRVNGRNATGDWLRAEISDTGETVWVFASLVMVDGDIDELTIVEGDDSAYAPMQAFSLRTGTDDEGCTEAPQSGLLVQIPEGAGEIFINGVNVRLGSTAFFQAEANDALYIYLLEGSAIVGAFGEQAVFEGTRVSVPLDENLTATGPPTSPEPYVAEAVESLPVNILPRPVTISDPATEAEIEEAFAALNACTITAMGEVNLRNGPGRLYLRSGGMSAGESATPVALAIGRNGYTWWRLSENEWVRSDVVASEGDCESLPRTTNIPLMPTPGPSWVDYNLHFCSGQRPIDAGDTVYFHRGCCGQATAEENDAMAGGDMGWISLDGVMMDVHFLPSRLMEEGFYSREVFAWWVGATPGTHTVSGGWQNSSLLTCTFTVE